MSASFLSNNLIEAQGNKRQAVYQHSGAERWYIMEDRKEIYGEWIFVCWRLYWRGMSDKSYIRWKDYGRHVSGDSIL